MFSNTWRAVFLSRTGQAVVVAEDRQNGERAIHNEPSHRRWLAGVATVVAMHISPASAQNLGQWTGTIPFPNIPVSAAVLPSGQLLTWSSYQPFFFEGDIGTTPSQTYVSVYDPLSGAFTPGIENSMMSDMFCSGIAYLGDGYGVHTFDWAARVKPAAMAANCPQPARMVLGPGGL